MTLLRRATDSSQSEWRPVDEGLWRWRIGKPELKLSEKFGNYQARFPLSLTAPEQQRLQAEHADEVEDLTRQGGQQSYRSMYTVGLSLGYVDKTGQYKTTKLVDFLAAALGSGQTKKFRDWIAQGGGPPRPENLNDQQAELNAIEDWLGWWEDLEVYGTITHRDGERGTFANFAGPMPVGSLPGQKDPDYDSLGRGKLRAIIAESGETREQHARENRVSVAAASTNQAPPQRFYADGTEVQEEKVNLNELPF